MSKDKSKSRHSKMSLDKGTGRYQAKLGKKKTKGGKIDGHKFRFTSDKKEAERRKVRIQELWDSIVERHGENALWDEYSLAVAKALEKGEHRVAFSADELAPAHTVRLQETGLRSQARLFALWLSEIQQQFPQFNIVAAAGDEQVFEVGKQQLLAKARREIDREGNLQRLLGKVSKDEPTVGEALDAYEGFILSEFTVEADWEEGLTEKRLTDTGKSYLDHVADIREHNGRVGHLDWTIGRLTFSGCQAMIDVWRGRPQRKDGSGQRAVKSCREIIKRLMNRKGFFRWLHRSDDFDWQKPDDFDELMIDVKETSIEISQRATPMQVDPYTIEELATLNSFANAFERFLLLAGLNLGFKRMEAATLRVSEIHLKKAHPHAEFLGFESNEADSFVKRLRKKSIVYGEWLLWPLTVQAMEWALARRRGQTRILSRDGKGRDITMRPSSLLLLNDNGHAFTKPTKGGNANHQLTNYWTQLLDRVCHEHPEFRRLPQENLRDSSANLIRQNFKMSGVSSSEVAYVFISHGKPFKIDNLLEVYTNKPFGAVFAACRWLQEKLQPVFDATPNEPFPMERKTGGGGRISRKKHEQILRLDRQGVSKAEIARRVKVSVMTVYRHLEQRNGSEK